MVSDLGLDKSNGIDLAVIQQNFVMHVGTRRPAGRPHLGDRLTPFNTVTHLDQNFLIVAVTGNVSVAMVDFDQVSLAVALTRPGDHSAGSGNHITATLAGKIHALVHLQLTAERVSSLAIIG